MRHLRFKYKLGKTGSHRRSMFANMAVSMLNSGRIETTLVKAKFFAPKMEKLITMSSRSETSALHVFRLLHSILRDEAAVKLLLDNFSLRYRDRPGGYTRIIKTGFRKGDNAPTALVEFV